jgi:hypothetical protein
LREGQKQILLFSSRNFAQLRVLRAFAVAHLKMGHGAAKRRDLGKSSRGEKNLQDISEEAKGVTGGLFEFVP